MNLQGIFVAGLAALVGAAAVGSDAQTAGVGDAVRALRPVEPVVVELFTAQGCSGCTEANRMVEALAEAPGVIALTWSVDYWDYLGWQDTFARPEFGQRQRAYQSALRLRGVYTPQVVIDGRRQVSGSDAEAVQGAIVEEAARRVFPPEIQFRESGDAVGIGSGAVPAGGADVWAVTYRPGRQDVSVSDGDNRGQVVSAVNVVRSLTRLGPWRGQPILLTLPAATDTDDRTVVLVQGRSDRRILTAAVL
ncbi:hypothetical protein BZG35_01850 [Brevundimonas sp. LM2]|uniref:DUF1223 domain-containing protein n=1 Tax=Brevundimonas sp. LM2 TaxID=1938605 RepID=UPI000983AD81|nr:DUF1223 domain-containing protein [Brevundimonas sp. LM2]AQR60536.1 hypothetical protein BZG35_01850 [Brevundimonas sp. LM2]